MAAQYEEISDAEIDLIFRTFVVRLLFPRTLCVVAVYATALALTGVSFFKAVAFCFVVWLLMVLPLGRSYIEKVGGIWIFIALVIWLDIPAVNKLIEITFAKVSGAF